MKSVLIPAVAMLAVVVWCGLAAAADWQYPVIKGAGEIVPLPNAAVQPDAGLKYKIVCDIIEWPKMEGKVVPGLAKVARLINVFASGGMSADKMDLVLVFHGPSTEAVIKPKLFEKKHGFANPSRDLLDQLKKAGVKMYVCGQALAEHNIAQTEVNPRVTIALSALTVLPTYQLKGYALMPF
jgi:intracellular sulfur oxidation DsrE/DsrF family protein